VAAAKVAVVAIVAAVVAALVAVPCAMAASAHLRSRGPVARSIDGQLPFLRAFACDVVGMRQRS
jgi:hypothetical protein